MPKQPTDTQRFLLKRVVSRAYRAGWSGKLGNDMAPSLSVGRRYGGADCSMPTAMSLARQGLVQEGHHDFGFAFNVISVGW